MVIDASKKFHYKAFLILTKYIPIIVSIIYMLYYIALIAGHNPEWMKVICKISFFSILYFYTSSKILEFCWCHRMFIYYLLFCDSFSLLYKHYSEYINLDLICWIRIIIGVILLIILAKHMIDNNLKLCNRKGK